MAHIGIYPRTSRHRAMLAGGAPWDPVRDDMQKLRRDTSGAGYNFGTDATDAYNPPNGQVIGNAMGWMGGANVVLKEWVCKGPNGGGVVNATVNGLPTYLQWVPDGGIPTAGQINPAGHWVRVEGVLSQEQMATLCQRYGSAPGQFTSAGAPGTLPALPGASAGLIPGTNIPIPGAQAGCYFQADDKRYKCTQRGRQSAANHARRLAAADGKTHYVLYVNAGVTTLDRAVAPGAMPVTGATQGACPAGSTPAMGPYGHMVCTPTPAAVAQAAPRRGASGRGGRRGRGVVKRKRGGMRGLGDGPVMFDGLSRRKIGATQALLRRLRLTDDRGKPVPVSGQLDPSTISAVNLYLLAQGRLPPNSPPLSKGEILVGLDPLIQRLAADANARRIQQMNGCSPCGGLGDAGQGQVERANRRYGGPNIPNWMLRMNIPRAQYTGAPASVQPRLSDYGCPNGYFPTQEGCVAASAFTSGTGFPSLTYGDFVRQSLSPWDLGPHLPGGMLNELVPSGGRW